MDTKQITVDFLDLEQVKVLAKAAFPPEGSSGSENLIRMAKGSDADFWGLYSENSLVGFMVICIFGDMCYLFFLSADSRLRSGGYGDQALHLISELYPDKCHVVDVEMIDPSASNSEDRISRKAFYTRAGYTSTGKFFTNLGVNYEILSKGEGFDFEDFKEMMKNLNIEGFSPRYFGR